VVFGADPLAVPRGDAPPLEQLAASEKRDLGLWDDVFAELDLDSMIVRRGRQLFRLSLTPSPRPVPLAKVPEARGLRIVAASRVKGSLWLFFESQDRAPFALEPGSGTRLDFEVPGLKVPPDRPPVIQSWVIAPHVGAAVLMISGGERRHWPRPRNDPIYFWVGLSARRGVQLPLGWDLEFFSADQKTAVLKKPQEKASRRRLLAALDMETGSLGGAVPNRQTSHWVPFDWSNKDQPKQLLAPRPPGAGAVDRFVGVSLDGRAVPLQVSLRQPYIPTMKALDGWLAFDLRGHGSPRRKDNSLWFSPLKKDEKPIRLAKHVMSSYEILAAGKCVFAASGFGPKQDSQEAFVYDAAEGKAWNVLEGVQRLPKLDPQLAGKGYVEDKMTVRLVQGFGKPTRGRLVLVLFSHRRGDLRSFVMGPSLRRQVWRRTVLLTSDGKRYETSVLRDQSRPDRIWLHNSGRIVIRTYKGGIQLHEIELKLR